MSHEAELRKIYPRLTIFSAKTGGGLVPLSPTAWDTRFSWGRRQTLLSLGAVLTPGSLTLRLPCSLRKRLLPERKNAGRWPTEACCILTAPDPKGQQHRQGQVPGGALRARNNFSFFNLRSCAGRSGHHTFVQRNALDERLPESSSQAGN